MVGPTSDNSIAPPSLEGEDPSKKLSEWYVALISGSTILALLTFDTFPSLFSQYSLTAASVVGATAYAVHRRPKNGIALMLVAGGAGTLADLAYGWTTKCAPYVAAYQQYQHIQQREKEGRRRKI